MSYTDGILRGLIPVVGWVMSYIDGILRGLIHVVGGGVNDVMYSWHTEMADTCCVG